MFYKQGILKIYAKRLLTDKIKSLENDVNKCLSESKNKELQSAVFTALLACFSSLDFLAAIYTGNARAGSSTTKQVKEFIEKYFNYSLIKRELPDLEHLTKKDIITILSYYQTQLAQ